MLTNTYISGPGFKNWSQLYEVVPQTLLSSYGNPGFPTVPWPVQAWYFLIMDCAVYGVLLWYFDNVIPNEFGAYQKPWFFLLPEYWGIKTAITDTENWTKLNKGEVRKGEEIVEDSDVANARSAANDPSFKPALKILNLRKVYSSAFSAPKVAVYNSSFSLEEGKLLALLGQNGAVPSI